MITGGDPMDFLQAKRKKERGQTNEEFLEWVYDNVKDFEDIAIVVKQPNNTVETFYSQEDGLSLLGTLEVAKSQLLSEMEG